MKDRYRVPDDDRLDEELDGELGTTWTTSSRTSRSLRRRCSARWRSSVPNVGKSTLVSRLSGTRQAVSRDLGRHARRKELVVEWTSGRRFFLIDTGGVDIADETPITRSIAVQAREAVAEADLVLFVVDAQIGITPGDEEVAQILREAKKPVLVIANKIDDPRMEPLALELHALGLGDPIPISGLHGHGAGDLLDEILDYLEAHATQGREEIPDEAIRVAILGRPNVGKSTLLNKLVGRERVIVSEIPGTTRDSIDTVLERGGRTFVLIDTAGLRRKRRHRQGIEYYSELRASSPPSARTSPSCSSMHPRASSTRISPWPTWRARRTTRR